MVIEQNDRSKDVRICPDHDILMEEIEVGWEDLKGNVQTKETNMVFPKINHKSTPDTDVCTQESKVLGTDRLLNNHLNDVSEYAI
jgi:hypothetical protein